jgi:hypothetical protein
MVPRCSDSSRSSSTSFQLRSGRRLVGSACSWRCSCASACCSCSRGSSGSSRKATGEIHQSLEGEEGHASSAVKATFAAVILQIMVVDMVFSLDSIITAVGMVDRLEVMISAVIVSVGRMMLFASAIGRFVSDHPTIKVLALIPGRRGRGADCRGLRPARAEGLCLLRHGVLGRGRDAEHPHAQEVEDARRSALGLFAKNNGR